MSDVDPKNSKFGNNKNLTGYYIKFEIMKVSSGF